MEAAALTASKEATTITGLEGETVHLVAHERITQFVLLQREGVVWKICAKVLPNNTASIVTTPTWTCCEDSTTIPLWQMAVASLVVLLFFVTIGVIAVPLRRQLHKQKMSKGPYKVILTPADFVFPQVGDNRRVSSEVSLLDIIQV